MRWPLDRAAVPARPVIGQQFPGIDVGRRDYGAPRSERVCQRARRALLQIEVGRHVDVGGAQELVEFFLAHEPVVEDDMLVDTQLAGERLQRDAVRLAMVVTHVRVGRPQHDVQRLGMGGHDGR
jgi:hypothetical protein